jgi:hypothetical protein
MATREKAREAAGLIPGMTKVKLLLRRMLLLAVLCFAASSPARAEDILQKNIHYFWPTTDGSGVLWTYGSEPLEMAHMYYGGYVDDAFQPVNVLNQNKNLHPLIAQQFGVQALFSVGLLNFVDLGVAVPFVAYRELENTAKYPGIPVATWEDLRVEAKWTILNRRQDCLGIGFVTRLDVPPAYRENNFSTDRGLALEPVFIFDLGRDWWTLAANVGYKYYTAREQSPQFGLRLGDELTLNAGMAFRFAGTHQILVDTATRTQVQKPFGTPDLDYSEVVLAYRKYWRNLNFTALTVGGGVGLLSGVGDPKMRFFIGITRDERRVGAGDLAF